MYDNTCAMRAIWCYVSYTPYNNVIMHIIINNTSGINAYTCKSLHRDDSADTSANIFEQMAVDRSVKFYQIYLV